MSAAFRSIPNFQRYLLAAIASTGGLLFGFNTGIISGALPLIQRDWQLDTFTRPACSLPSFSAARSLVR